MPDGWPERPAFARFRVDVAVKPDGRRVAYYEWPEDPDHDDRLVQDDAAETGLGRKADDDV